MASKRPGLFISLYGNNKLFGRGVRDSEKAIPDKQNEDLHPDEEDGVASAVVGDEDIVAKAEHGQQHKDAAEAHRQYAEHHMRKYHERARDPSHREAAEAHQVAMDAHLSGDKTAGSATARAMRATAKIGRPKVTPYGPQPRRKGRSPGTDFDAHFASHEAEKASKEAHRRALSTSGDLHKEAARAHRAAAGAHRVTAEKPMSKVSGVHGSTYYHTLRAIEHDHLAQISESSQHANKNKKDATAHQAVVDAATKFRELPHGNPGLKKKVDKLSERHENHLLRLGKSLSLISEATALLKAGADQESASWNTMPDPVQAKRQSERIGMRQPYGESGVQTPDLPERGLDWHGDATPDDSSDDAPQEGTAAAKKIWGDPQPILEEPKKEEEEEQPVEKAMLPKEYLKHTPGHNEVQWSESDRHFENFHPKMADNHAAQAKWHGKQAKQYPKDHPAHKAHTEAADSHVAAAESHDKVKQSKSADHWQSNSDAAMQSSGTANKLTVATHEAARSPYQPPPKKTIWQKMGLGKGLEDYQAAQAHARQSLAALPSLDIGPRFSPKEIEFLMIKGYTEEDFVRGRIRVTPHMRAEYNQFVTDTVFKSLTSLKDHRR